MNNTAPLPAHGGDIWTATRQFAAYAPSGRGEVQDFSTNTFLHMADRTTSLLSTVLAPLLTGHASPFLHYPDPHMHDLRQKLADYEGLDVAHILPGSGASELIWAVLTALRPRKALCIGPLFSQYARACDALGIAWDVLTPDIGLSKNSASCGFTGAFAPDEGTLARVEKSRHDGVDLIILCSPNNPGTAVMHDPLPLFQAVGNRTLLLDASYKDFLGTNSDAINNHHWQNLQHLSAGAVVVLGSLTKFFCCPGVRLGWVAAEANLIERIALCRPAWTMPALAQDAGLALLHHAAEYRASLPLLQGDVAELEAMLHASRLFDPIFSGVSFAVAQLKNPGTARQLQDFLLRRGLLIRVCDNIPGMPPDFIRIQAQPVPRCAALREGLRLFRDTFMMEG